LLVCVVLISGTQTVSPPDSNTNTAQ